MLTMESSQQTLLEALVAQFGEAIQHASEPHGFLTVEVAKAKVHDVLVYLASLPEHPFSFLTDLTGIHYPDQAADLGVIYHLHDLRGNRRIRIKTFMATAHAHLPTATDIFPAANWMERETFDFFGIHFDGHPNLMRILNMEDMLIHPLRKEFPLEDQSRKDKNDAMFGR